MRNSSFFGENRLKWPIYVILVIFVFSFACAQTEAKWPVEGWDFDIYNVSLSENVINPNETLYVTVTIENTGTKLGTVHVYLGIENPSGSRTYLGPRIIYDIPVGGRDTTTFTWLVPSNAEGGNYKATVDVYNSPETHMFDTSGFIYSFEIMSPARLSVTVRKSTGDLMPGSEINGLVLYQDNYSNDIQNVDPSSSSYTFENLSPGHSYLVEVYVTDMYAGDTGWVYMGSGDSESKTIYCPIYGTLNFQVFYSDGTTPLGNAYVEVYGGTQAWRSDSTDTQGKTIDFYLMPTTLASNQSYYAIVKYNELQVGSVYGIQLSPGESKPTIKIITDENPPGGNLTVTVRKSTEELMPGSEINGLVLYQDNYSNDIQNVDPSSSSYTFENLSPGHSYLVEVYVTDMYAGDTGWVYMGSGDSESKTIYCPIYGTLNFQVFYSDGTTPLGNAYVEVYGGTQAWRSDSTDTQGKTIDFYLMPTTLASNQSYYAIVKYNELQVGSVYGIQLSPGESKPTLQIITTIKPPPISEKGWGCWLYGKQDSFANDINSYNEQASLEERIRYIFAYSGTLDLQTLNLSYDINVTMFYAQRISGAYVLPMIDSSSGLSSLSSTQLNTLSANVAMKLNNDPYASGVHFNIEPDDPKLPEFLMYLRSHLIRSDFIITVTVGNSSVSSELPITFWENLFFQTDFIVLMNYDLASDIQEGDCSYGSVDNYYLKAKSKATELLQLASFYDGFVMIGVPGIATHHEFEMRVKNDGTIEYSGHAMIEYLESGLDAVETTLQEMDENNYIGISIWSFLDAPIGSWCDPNCPGICDRLWDYYPFEIGVNATIETTTIDYGPYSSGDDVVANVKITNYETLRLLNNDYPLHIGFSVRSPSGIIFDAPSTVGSFEGNTFFETQFSWNVPDYVELGLYDATVAVWVDVNRNGIIDGGDIELDRWGWSQYIFEVIESTHVPPTPPSNLMAETISETEIVLFWDDNSNNESGFNIYCNRELIGTVEPDITNYDVLNLTCGTTYTFHVAAYNNYGESSSNTITTSTHACGNTPNPPILVSPVNNSITSNTTPTFSWNSSSGAASYRLQVATDTGFSNNIINTTTSNTSYTPSSVLTEGTYYWRVNASNSHGPSAWSSVWNFIISESQQSVVLVDSWIIPDYGEAQGLAWDGTYILSLNEDTHNIILKHDPGNPLNILRIEGVRGDGKSMAWDGNNIWAAESWDQGNNYYSTLFRFEGYNEQSYTEIPCNGGPFVGLTWKNGYIWALSASSPYPMITKIDPNTGTILATYQIDISGSVSSIEWDSDRGVFWLGKRGSNTICMLDGDNPSVIIQVCSVEGIEGADGLAYDGQYLWACSANSGYLYKLKFLTSPKAPSGLYAGPVYTETSIQLNWVDNSNDETEFRIYVNGQYRESVQADTTSHTVASLTCETPYTFYVTAYNNNGESPPSNTVTASTTSCTPPGRIVWQNEMRVTYLDYRSRHPDMAIDANGITHIVWADETPNGRGYDIFYNRYDGTSWGNDIRITQETDPDPSAKYPRLAIDSSNNIHIVWIDSRSGSYEIYYAKLDNLGNILVSPQLLTTADEQKEYWVDIAVDSRDRLHLVWQHKNESINNYEIHYMVLANNGVITIHDRILYSDNYANAEMPKIAIDSGDCPHIVYTRSAYQYSTDEIFYTKLDCDGNILVQEKEISLHDGYDSYYPNVAVDSGGYIHIVWRDIRDGMNIYYIQLDNNGNTLIDDIPLGLAKDMGWPTITVGPSNTICVAWQGEDGIYFTRFDGTSWTPNKKITSDSAIITWWPEIAWNKSDEVSLVWSDSRDGNQEIYFIKGMEVKGTVFGNLPNLFPSNSFHVVGDKAACTDVLGTANISWYYGSMDMYRPDGKTEGILPSNEHNTSNLMFMGGPAVSDIADEFDTYFGITHDFQPGMSFTIFCEGQQIYLDLTKYPSQDICIVYLGPENTRNVLVIWGYGWEGTYAGSVFMSHPAVWDAYPHEHLLLLRWNDDNGDGFIEFSEVHPENVPEVPVTPPSQSTSQLLDPVFGNIPSLFTGDAFHVVGDKAACTDVLGTANISWAYGSINMHRPDGKTEGILFPEEHNTSNLMLMGGPAVSDIADEFDTYFGITHDFQPGVSFTIFCEGQQIYLDLTTYPSQDICIVYLGQQNNRNVLEIWGYGWEGTYAGSVFISNPLNWSLYGNSHMLMLRWRDVNSDGFVQMNEITVEAAV
jgi:hypothetical protein